MNNNKPNKESSERSRVIKFKTSNETGNALEFKNKIADMESKNSLTDQDSGEDPSNKDKIKASDIFTNKKLVIKQEYEDNPEKLNPYYTVSIQKEIADGKLTHNSDFFSVKEYCYKEDKNFRPYMEDYSKVYDLFCDLEELGLFLILDGHGGAEVAKYVRDKLPEMLEKELGKEVNQDNPIKEDRIKAIINETFQRLDEDICKNEDWAEQGSTACLVITEKEGDVLDGEKVNVYCANIGDTRCVLADKDKVTRISVDHKPGDKEESDRIKSTGASVYNGRVFGQLAVSRSFGDFSYKKHGVIVVPTITVHRVSPEDGNFLVIASDGIWDTVDDEDIKDFIVASNGNISELTQMIVSEAIKKGSLDNISCLVLRIF